MEKLKENTQEINKKSIEKNINSEEIKTQISIFLYDSWIKSPWERKEIFWILEEKIGEKKILEISSSFPNLKILVEQNSKKEIFVFNVEEKKFVENIEENVSELPKKFEETQNIFDAMDEIFKQNKKEVFGELNKEDILKTDNFDKNWLKLKWKNLRDLQIILKENFEFLKNSQINFSKEQRKIFLYFERRYLEIVMWVWDFYEWMFLLETQGDFEKYTDNLVKNSNLTELFVWLVKLHKQIDENNFKSENVENSNRLLLTTLSSKIFEKLKEKNANPQEFLFLAKIITGRWSYNEKNWSFEKVDIDDDFRENLLASEILSYLFKRKWWIFEKINFKNLDKKLIWKNVSDVCKDFDDLMTKATWQENPENLKTFFGFDSKKFSWKKYEDLSLEDQIKLSSIKNFTEKLEKKLNPKKVYWPYAVGQMNQKPEKIDFWELIRDSVLDSTEEAIESFDEIISSDNIFEKSYYSPKSAKDFWLTWVDKEIFDLFKDLNWTWIFKMSDNSFEATKTWAKMIWLIWVVILAASIPWVNSLVLQWAIAGWVWSIASWGFFPKWYDTKTEAFTDLWSDLVVWTVTWAVWWQLTTYGISKWGTHMPVSKQALLNWADVWLLGFLPEFYRIETVEKYFHEEKLLQEETWKKVSLAELYEKKDKKEQENRKILEQIDYVWY